MGKKRAFPYEEERSPPLSKQSKLEDFFSTHNKNVCVEAIEGKIESHLPSPSTTKSTKVNQKKQISLDSSDLFTPQEEQEKIKMVCECVDTKERDLLTQQIILTARTIQKFFWRLKQLKTISK